MLKTVAMNRSALALLLAGVIVGAAGAQVGIPNYRTRYVTTGLFRVTAGETVNFHVTLDTGPAGLVRLRLLDPGGATVVEKPYKLAAGQSATLVHSVPGLYRAQADVESTLLRDRIVVATVEVLGDDAAGAAGVFGVGPAGVFGANGAAAGTFVKRTVCTPDGGHEYIDPDGQTPNPGGIR
jgi:hypothetical protein